MVAHQLPRFRPSSWQTAILALGFSGFATRQYVFTLDYFYRQ
jgi:hypothetical protein